MHYEDLYHRYGVHVSQRVRQELTPSEFEKVSVAALPDWLESRAESAHETYRRLLSNPLAELPKDQMRAGEACRRWREAEDLAYLVVIAEDVGAVVRAA